jgi:adenylate kinase
MFVALTGTPGTGKSTVAQLLQQKGYTVLDLHTIAVEQHCIIGVDSRRQSQIIDTDKVDSYIQQTYASQTLCFIEGHLSHLLSSVEKIILWRCHPRILRTRLAQRGWSKAKIEENVEAEILDVILCETLDRYPREHIFEIDASTMSPEEMLSCIQDLIDHNFEERENYKVGCIDWSEELLKD